MFISFRLSSIVSQLVCVSLCVCAWAIVIVDAWLYTLTTSQFCELIFFSLLFCSVLCVCARFFPSLFPCCCCCYVLHILSLSFRFYSFVRLFFSLCLNAIFFCHRSLYSSCSSIWKTWPFCCCCWHFGDFALDPFTSIRCPFFFLLSLSSLHLSTVLSAAAFNFSTQSEEIHWSQCVYVLYTSTTNATNEKRLLFLI